MPIAYERSRVRFRTAVRDLASNQAEIAALAGVTPARLSDLLHGRLADSPKEQKYRLDICRRGLMAQAALLGRDDAELMKYTEHAIFGLPAVDPAVAVPEARQRAREIRAERDSMRSVA